MRIGIDARFFGTEQRGIGRYVQRLIENLEILKQIQDNRNFEFYLLLRRENWHEYQPQNQQFKKVLASWRWYSIGEQLFLPGLLRKLNLNLVHFTNFNVPLIYRDKFVVTIHDLQMQLFPTDRATTRNKLWYGLKRQAMAHVTKQGISRAAAVIVPTDHVKKQVSDYLPGYDEKIKVVYEGVDFAQRDYQANFSQADLVLLKYKINQPYIFYLGAAFPHKNLANLIKAFDLIKNKYAWPGTLVLAGRRDYFYNRLAREFNLDQRKDVVLPGFIEERDLPIIYANADLYVQPSFDEGFGLTPLEALLAGTPAAVGANTSLEEILGEAACYFEPNSPEAMAGAIHSLIVDEEMKKNLVAKSKTILESLNWQKTAKATFATYLQVITE